MDIFYLFSDFDHKIRPLSIGGGSTRVLSSKTIWMIIDRKKEFLKKSHFWGVGAFYRILPISGVRFGGKINDQHLIMNGADVRDQNDLGY